MKFATPMLTMWLGALVLMSYCIASGKGTICGAGTVFDSDHSQCLPTPPATETKMITAQGDLLFIVANGKRIGFQYLNGTRVFFEQIVTKEEMMGLTLETVYAIGLEEGQQKEALANVVLNQAVTDRIYNATIARIQGDQAEATAREAADAVIASSVSAELIARLQADQGLNMSLAAESFARTLADQSLQQSLNQAITTETIARLQADWAVNVSVSASIATIATTVNMELSARIAADQVFSTTIGSSMTAFTTTMTSSLTNVNSSLSSEIAARVSTLAVVTTSVAAEASRATAEENALQSMAAIEASTRAAADLLLQGSLATESSTRLQLDQALNVSCSYAIGLVAVAANTGLAAVNSSLSNEMAARINSLAAVTSSLIVEASTRSVTDQGLQNSMATEAAARQLADQTLNASFSYAISTLAASFSTSINSSLTNEMAARVYSVTAAMVTISTETSRAVAAENSLQALVATESSSRSMADQALGTTTNATISAAVAAVSTVVAAVNSSLTVELTSRSNAVALVTSALMAEASRASTAESNLQASLTTESSSRSLVDQSLSTSISSSQVTMASINTSLGGEIARAIAGDNSLQQAVAAEASTRAAADVVEAAVRSSAVAAVNGSLAIEIAARVQANQALMAANQVLTATVQGIQTQFAIPSAPVIAVGSIDSYLAPITLHVNMTTPATTGVFPITAYTLYYKAMADGSFTKIATVVFPFNLVVPLSRLAINYTMYATATSVLGEGPPSGNITVTCPPPPYPSSPVLSVAAVNVNYPQSIQVSLSTAANSPVSQYPVTSYTLYYTYTSITSFIRVVVGPATNFPYTLVVPKDNVLYSVYATASSTIGEGVGSNNITATMPTLPGLRIVVEGHADVVVQCAVGDYSCQAHNVCNQVTSLACVYQTYDCGSGSQGSWYPPDGSSGSSNFNFAFTYDFWGQSGVGISGTSGMNGNICSAGSPSQLARYGLSGTHSWPSGHWYRV